LADARSSVRASLLDAASTRYEISFSVSIRPESSWRMASCTSIAAAKRGPFIVFSALVERSWLAQEHDAYGGGQWATSCDRATSRSTGRILASDGSANDCDAVFWPFTDKNSSTSRDRARCH
jgi:hypothetical protein